MAITYTWKFNSLETKPTDGDLVDVVTTVDWELIADNGLVSVFMGDSMYIGVADSENFTAFTDLTEDIVKGWVLHAMAGEDETNEEVEARLEQTLADKIDAIANPTMVSRIAPWNT